MHKPHASCIIEYNYSINVRIEVHSESKCGLGLNRKRAKLRKINSVGFISEVFMFNVP